MSVILQYPYVSPTTTLTLRNPERGNSEELDIKTQYVIAADGTFRSYIRTPESYRLNMTFRTLQQGVTCGTLTYTEVDDLISFIQTAAGGFIKLTDWDSQVWKVKLLTSPAQFIQANRSFHEVTLEFEGELIP